MPRHVEREMEGFLACGDPTNGFAWLQCDGCDHHRLVTFSCKGRGFCGRCGGRRMAERSAWWVDRLIPRVATRQWVLTVPWKRRWLLARRPALATGVHRVAMRIIERWYAKTCGAGREGRSGAVTVVQRFGSALNLNLHFHAIFLDGVYTRAGDGRLGFRQTVPHTEDVERLVVSVGEACERWLARKGFGPEEDGDVEEDDAQAVIQNASLLGQVALGERAGKKARRIQVLGGRELTLPPRCASFEGYNLHAGVGIKAGNREGLERLCRYILRPPLAKARLERRADGSVVVGLKCVWSDGSTALVFTPLELTERLVAIVPPPRANQVIYRGVLAGKAGWRKEVIPTPRPETPAAAAERRARRLSRRPRLHFEGERPSWDDLLRRVFSVEGFQCPTCGGALRLRTLVLNPVLAKRIIAGLQRATGPPAP